MSDIPECRPVDDDRTTKVCGIAPNTLPPEMRVNLGRRQVNAMLLMGLLVLHPAVRAQGSEPPYLVTDFDWVDHARSRSVPLVVFSHGIGGSRQGYSYLGKHWLARGVASLHVQHVGSDVQLWKGNPFGVVGRLQAAAREEEAIARAGDVRFALDRMLSDETGNRGAAVDRQRLVAAGHSYGANTMLLTVGSEVIRNGQTINCLDSRFSAAVVISAPPFYGESDLKAVLSKVSVPTIHVTSTDDDGTVP